MGKSLYLLKIFLLHDLFPLINAQTRRITRLVGFVVNLYARYFLSAPLSTAAPRHDLTLWCDHQTYRQYDRVLADVSLRSVRRHLWYLCPELVVLALFDDGTGVDEKQAIAVTLANIMRPHVLATGKPGHPDFNPIATHLTDEKPSLPVFVTERSWLMFHLLESDAVWLTEHPAVWDDYDDYEHCKRFYSDMLVVNDAAERAVKDVQNCAQMTRDPALSRD